MQKEKKNFKTLECSQDLDDESKVSAVWVSPEASPLGLQAAAFSLGAHTVFPLRRHTQVSL